MRHRRLEEITLFIRLNVLYNVYVKYLPKTVTTTELLVPFPRLLTDKQRYVPTSE